MKSLPFKTLSLALLAAAVVFFPACGKKNGESTNPAEVVIPDSPDAAVQKVIREFSQGNGGIAWQALPASYQSDINKVAHHLAANSDKDIYNKSFSLFSHLTKVIDQQRGFIVNSSLIKDRSPEDLAQLEAALPSIVGFMNSIASSELSSIEQLLNFNGESFFETTVSECIEYLEAVGNLTDEDSTLANSASAVVSVVSKDENRVVLLIAVPGQAAEEVAFTKVENRWVPAEIANKWQEGITEIMDSIDEMNPEDSEAQKTRILGALTMLDGILTNIQSAETQEQFDQSLKDSTMPLMSTYMMFNQVFNSSE